MEPSPPPGITRSGSLDEAGLRQASLKEGTPCVLCGKPTARRAMHCSMSCAQKRNSMKRDPAVEAERRRKISIRMAVVRTEIPNPMHDPEVVKRVSNTLRAMGHRPAVRGGNGTGPTECESLLLAALEQADPHGKWVLGFAIACGASLPRGERRASGLPTCFKPDITDPVRKIAIEVDGNSHKLKTRKEQDARKTAFLQSRGWSVFRAENADVKADATAVAARILTSIR